MGNTFITFLKKKRNAHQAMDDISLQLRKGKVQVIDADIAKYFDTILHNKLLKFVSERIVDKHILRIIKMWLKAPVVEEREDEEFLEFAIENFSEMM